MQLPATRKLKAKHVNFIASERARPPGAGADFFSPRAQVKKLPPYFVLKVPPSRRYGPHFGDLRAKLCIAEGECGTYVTARSCGTELRRQREECSRIKRGAIDCRRRGGVDAAAEGLPRERRRRDGALTTRQVRAVCTVGAAAAISTVLSLKLFRSTRASALGLSKGEEKSERRCRCGRGIVYRQLFGFESAFTKLTRLSHKENGNLTAFHRCRLLRTITQRSLEWVLLEEVRTSTGGSAAQPPRQCRLRSRF
ncbi:hypothetical protein EVAR_94072_1 [Eumeta japonica]|uniref:Uncharacterized protein n=1 Tax=Eumeta variegata TaxID=151549 RepID=A0A4C1V606_EUMVA|nr:hypothetical protein EVAR_94072_1 [Eumeta japonica]